MNKFLTVLSHTYFSKLKSKAFLITSLIVLLVMLGIANVDKVIKFFSSNEADQIAVLDPSDEIYPVLQLALENTDENITLTSYERNVEEGKTAVLEDEFAALLVLERDADQMPTAILYEKKATSSLRDTILNELQQIKVQMATEQAGVDAATLSKIYEEIPFENVALDTTAKTEEELNSARGIIYVMLFILYMAVMLYGQMIATEVATEKSSRVMEILISSASPITHMFAKIIGVGLLGLTQIIFFLISGYLIISNRIQELSGGFFEVFGFGTTKISVYIYAVIFFLLGYFLYATIAAMLGSLVSRVEDVQQLILPVTFLIMIAFFIAIFGLGVPDATFITITSFIPFFSPMIMFLRVGMIEVPVWQIALSMGILLGTIYLFAMIGARIYRGGVLMYGASRSLKDLKNALILTKKE